MPSCYGGGPAEASSAWEPEFSLGQLYNKGLFLLGYYNEVNEFARSILENRPPAKGTLEHAWQVTRLSRWHSFVWKKAESVAWKSLTV